MKYLGINLMKEKQILYTENYETPRKTLKNLNKSERHPTFIDKNT